MSELFDVVIVGAGQSGLSVSYYLKKHNIKHILLEKEGLLVPSWRNRKWDAFTLVTPNSMNQLPEFPCTEFDENVFLNKLQVCQYIENFSRSFNPPVKFNVDVERVSKTSDGNFEIKTNVSTLSSKIVVVASGNFNRPNIPGCADNIPSSITQLHSSEYKNSDQLPTGSVLVVGTAQSGAQIIEDLVACNRKVYCATSKVVKSPRVYRGKDISKWARLIGLLDLKSPTLTELNGRFPSSPQITGRDGGREIHLQLLSRQGAVLLGKLLDSDGETLYFADNLAENMRFAESSCVEWQERVDNYINENQLDAPPSDYTEPAYDDYGNTPTSLSIHESGIGTIIWATGYKHDFSWIREDVFDEYSYPVTTRGVSACDGLFFVGMQGTDRNKTVLLYGVSEHAQYISNQILSSLKI